GFLRALAGPWRKVFTTAPETARAAEPEALAREVKEWNVPVRARATVAEALAEALAWVGSRGRVLVTGSLFTVGDAMRALGDPPPGGLRGEHASSSSPFSVCPLHHAWRTPRGTSPWTSRPTASSEAAGRKARSSSSRAT